MKTTVPARLAGPALLLAGVMFAVGCDKGSEPASGAAAETDNTTVVAAAPQTAPELPECCQLEALPPRFPVAAEDATTEPDPADTAPAAVAEGTPAAEAKSEPVVAPPTGMTARASEWLAPADREQYDFNYEFATQTGETINLESYLGKPVAMSFIFTRCGNPQMCPAITAQMATLESRLKDAGLEGKVKLALMTYDPNYDTPERLHAYGQMRGMKYTHADMLQPDVDRFAELIYEFGIDAKYGPQGVASHGMDLYLFDKQGRRVRYYTGGLWDNEAVIADLQKLLAEPDENV